MRYFSLVTLLLGACITKAEHEELLDESCLSAVDNFLFDCDHDGYGIPIVEANCDEDGFPERVRDCGVNIEDYPATEDCDDEDADLFPSLVYPDADSDGFGAAAGAVEQCGAGSGYVEDNTDCDDADGDVNPGATELCNDADDNCNGLTDEDLPPVTTYLDGDGDGYGDPGSADSSCGEAGDRVLDGTDCDDTNGWVYPGAPEILNDGLANGCDGGEVDVVELTSALLSCDGSGSSCPIAVGDLAGDDSLEVHVGSPGEGKVKKWSGGVASDFASGTGSFGASVAEAFGGLVVGAPAESDQGEVTLLSSAAVEVVTVTDTSANINQIGARVAGSEYGAMVSWRLYSTDDQSYDGRVSMFDSLDSDRTVNATDVTRIRGLSAFTIAPALAFEDVNGDGAADALVGDPGSGIVAGDGSFYFFSEPSGLLNTSNALARPTGTSNSHLGTAIAIGDIDNDGTNDVAVSAPGASSNAGVVYLLLSSDTDTWQTTTFGIADAPATLTGRANDNAGASLSIVDRSADGAVTTLLIGADDAVYLYEIDSTISGSYTLTNTNVATGSGLGGAVGGIPSSADPDTLYATSDAGLFSFQAF